MMLRYAKQIWRGLRHTETNRSGSPFAALTHQTLRATMIVRFFLLYLLYEVYAISMITWTPRTLSTDMAPLWPLFWAPYLPTEYAVGGIILFAIGSGLLAFLLPQYTITRLAFGIGFFLLATLTSSYGRINHTYHALFITLLLLATLPNGNPSSVTGRHHYLSIFWFVQLAIGVMYTLSGLWKIVFGILQASTGEIGTLHPHALAMFVAFRLLQTNQVSILGSLIIDYPLLGWPLHYGAVAAELLCVIAVFRPRLHVLWGLLLMSLHIGTWLMLAVPFPAHVILAGLFLVMSPFTPPDLSWRSVVGSLPIIGDLIQLRSARRMRRIPL